MRKVGVYIEISLLQTLLYFLIWACEFIRFVFSREKYLYLLLIYLIAAIYLWFSFPF